MPRIYPHDPTLPSGGSVVSGDVPDATTSAKGKVELATDGEVAAGVVVQGNDGRLSNARTPSAHAHAQSDVTALDTALAGKSDTGHTHAAYQATSEKGQANGYAGLGTDGKVPAAQLPVGGSDPFVARLVLDSDKPTGANVTPVTLGLAFAFEANSKYAIDIYALVAPGAATTGCGFLIDVSAAVTYVGTHVTHQLAATGTLSGASSVGDAAVTLSGVSSGMPATATYPVLGGGILISGANTGTATFYFRSETTAVTTCMAGTLILVTKVA